MTRYKNNNNNNNTETNKKIITHSSIHSIYFYMQVY